MVCVDPCPYHDTAISRGKDLFQVFACVQLPIASLYFLSCMNQPFRVSSDFDLQLKDYLISTHINLNIVLKNILCHKKLQTKRKRIIQCKVMSTGTSARHSSHLWSPWLVTFLFKFRKTGKNKDILTIVMHFGRKVCGFHTKQKPFQADISLHNPEG